MLNISIEKQKQLDKATLNDLKSFVEQNNAKTGFPVFYYWDAIEHRKSHKLPFDWLCYSEDKLIAYVAIYYFSGNKLDINISLVPEMYPQYPEILLQLYDEIYNTFKRFRIFATVFHVNFEDRILTSALQDFGANPIASSKYMLRQTNRASYTPTILNYKLADESHIELLADIQATCYPVDKDEYKYFLSQSMHNKNRQAYLFYLYEDPIAKIHLLHEGKQALIEDLCIIPTMQHKGYDKLVLQEICNLVNKTQQLLIEIDEDFEYLSKLYQELDFELLTFIHHYDRNFGLVKTIKEN